MKTKNWIAIFIILGLPACQSAGDHINAVSQTASDQNLTVAKAQVEIKKGMGGSDVLQSLGSPNIVSTDTKGNEVWVYDKISTISANSDSANGLNLILFITTASSGARSTNQRTLTIIVKFDKNKLVNEVRYHSSSF